ncbi:hypothetical protein [Pseudarthrobacter sulfonivorans]|uniref:hypothetical protein n=1 Tax=Pseudarthrobacter sulfonivorans TaxID=121292 RepID=UPI002857AF08|nr:hypothetical protein [Pseudarthrobacter sulfonivorans]MDR6415647.1 hypothetical protein [Pseudarthrobacter sulfonivorans]
MDQGVATLVGLGGVLVLMAIVFVLNSIWQRRHRRTRPPRHQGEWQSQRGREYKNPPPTNHNQDQWSGWP